jgi:hypothetical protein
MKPMVNSSHKFAKVFSTRGFGGSTHKIFVMVDRLIESDLEPVTRMVDAVTSVTVSGGPVSREMGKRSHDHGRSRTRHPALDGYQADVAGLLAQARVSLHFRADNEVPVAWVGNIFEQMYGRVNGSDDPM